MADSNTLPPKSWWSGWATWPTAIAVVVLAVSLISFLRAQKSNQFAPPIPGGSEPPVVESLPKLIAEMERIKLSTEGAAGRAKAMKVENRISPDQLHTGQDLYSATRGCALETITFVSLAMERRFKTSDEETVAGLVEKTRSADQALQSWLSSVDKPAYGTAGVETIKELIDGLVSDSTRQNEEQIKFWRARLEAAKIRSWAEVPADRD